MPPVVVGERIQVQIRLFHIQQHWRTGVVILWNLIMLFSAAENDPRMNCFMRRNGWEISSMSN